MQTKAHADYLAWGWDVLLRLKLHESEMMRLDENYDERISELDEGISTSTILKGIAI